MERFLFAFFVGLFKGGGGVGKVPGLVSGLSMSEKKNKGWAARAEANRLQSEHPSDLWSVESLRVLMSRF